MARPRGTRSESREEERESAMNKAWKTVGGGRDSSGYREKFSSQEMDENADKGKMKLCKTSRERVKERVEKGVWITEWVKCGETG